MLSHRMPIPLPLPLTFAEGHDLAARISAAIASAQDAFLQDAVVCNPAGTPIGGPDPRSVHAESTLVIARILVARGLDLVGAEVFESKIARLEATIIEHTRTGLDIRE